MKFRKSEKGASVHQAFSKKKKSLERLVYNQFPTCEIKALDMHKIKTSGVDLLSTSTERPAIISSAEREVKDSCSSGMFQSCNFGTSECLEVASALVRVQVFWRLPPPLPPLSWGLDE